MIEVGLDEMMRSGDVSPETVNVCELLFEWRDFICKGSSFDAEPRGETRPHPVPPKDVAVDYVESLISSGGSGCGPFKMTGKKTSVGHVGEAVPLWGGAREKKWPARFATDGCVDGEGDAHVHGVAESVADDGMRTMNVPGEVVAGCGGKEFVFLSVVEVFYVETRLFFPEGRCRQFPFAVGFKGS